MSPSRISTAPKQESGCQPGVARSPKDSLSLQDAVWLCAIVAIGINLRPLLTSISPLMPTIRAATGLSFYGASLLTSLPVVAMGIGAFAASIAGSGSLLAAMTAFQAAAALLLPLAAASFRDRRPWLTLGLSAQLVGIVGLTLWPLAAPLLWVAAAGAGLGGTFSVTLVTALDHSEHPGVAARLTAFTQGVGFIIAALAPIVAGLVRDATGTFTAAWIMLAASISAMIALTWVFSPRSYARAMGLLGSEHARSALPQSNR